jgi:hypothetical protein
LKNLQHHIEFLLDSIIRELEIFGGPNGISKRALVYTGSYRAGFKPALEDPEAAYESPNDCRSFSWL